MAAVIVPTTAPWRHPDPIGVGSDAPFGGRPRLRVLEGGPSAARAHRRAARPAPVERRAAPGPLRVSTLRVPTLAAGLVTGLVVALALVGLAHLAGAGTAASGPVSTAASSPAEVIAVAPAAATTVVVRPDDTLWSIARTLQPGGDVRNLVDRLAERSGGPELVAGQRIDVTGL